MILISNLGVPPRGNVLEYGVVVGERMVAKSRTPDDRMLRDVAVREALIAGIDHYFDRDGQAVYFTETAKAGEIRGPFVLKSAPMPFVCYLRGEEGWVQFSSHNPSDAFRRARSYRDENLKEAGRPLIGPP